MYAVSSFIVQSEIEYLGVYFHQHILFHGQVYRCHGSWPLSHSSFFLHWSEHYFISIGHHPEYFVINHFLHYNVEFHGLILYKKHLEANRCIFVLSNQCCHVYSIYLFFSCNSCKHLWSWIYMSKCLHNEE